MKLKPGDLSIVTARGVLTPEPGSASSQNPVTCQLNLNELCLVLSSEVSVHYGPTHEEFEVLVLTNGPRLGWCNAGTLKRL